MSGERVAVRAYSTFTRLYPRRFRDEYGADMVSLFRDQCRDEPMWRVLPRCAVDLAITIPIQHVETKMRRAPSRLVPLTYLSIATGGLLLAIVGGTNITTVIIGLGIALGAGTIGALAWRRTTPAHETTVTSNWWKYFIAGPCIIAVVIIAAGAGVEAWELMIACMFTAFVLTTIGLVLGLSHLYNRRTRGIAT